MCDDLSSDVHQFADDITLILTFEDPIPATITINNDLYKLAIWAEQWRVTFNPVKTYFLHMSNKRKNIK